MNNQSLPTCSTQIHWNKTTFEEICDRLIQGGTPTTSISSYWNGTTPWITGADFNEHGISQIRRHINHEAIINSSTNIVPAGNILLVTRTGVGKIAISTFDVAISQDITGIILCKQKAESKFLYYHFQHNIEDLKKLNQGTSINGILRNDLLNYAILLPNCLEQQKIAEILTTVDNLIEQTEAAIAKYQAIKQGMMHDLFTRGVDANGHLRPPREEAPGLYKESELGWIPKGWDVVKLSCVIPSATYGISHSLDDEFGIPVLRMNNLNNGTINLSSLKMSDKHIPDSILLKHYDVLFNRTNSMEHVGRTSLWESQLRKATFASYIVRLNIDHDKTTPRFLVYWLNQKQIQNEIRKRSTPGVHQVNINPKNLRKTKIKLPACLEEQNQITTIIDEQNGLLRIEEQKLSKLKQIKSGLMQDLLSGRVRVPTDPAPTQEPHHAA